MLLFLILFIPFILSNGKGYKVVMESLTEWKPIRIYFDLDIPNEEKKAILKETTDNIAKYLNKLLKVHPCKYIQTIANNEGFTDKTIYNIDFYISIKSLPVGDDAAASTRSYYDHNNDVRPKIAMIKMNLNIIEKASNVDDNPRDLFEILIHEVFHALGVSEGMVQYWIDPDNMKSYIWNNKNPFHTCIFPGDNIEHTFVTTKIIKEFIKQKYGDDDFGKTVDGTICETGIELEDNGGDGSKGKHPEMRVYPYEIMAYNHDKGKIHAISDLTLMLLNSSLFYEVNFDMAESYHFGYPETNFGKPINKFVVGSPAKVWPKQYQCRPADYGLQETSIRFSVCNPDMRGVSSCDRFQYYCNSNRDICANKEFIDPENTGYSGTNQDYNYIAFPLPKRPCSQQLPSNDVEVLRYGSTNGDSSVCFTSSVRKDDNGYIGARCFNISCNNDFSSYTVTLADGTTGTCTQKDQNLTFPNSQYKYGYIVCNDPYWACYASNNYHPPDYVEPPPNSDDESGGDDSSKDEPIIVIPTVEETEIVPEIVIPPDAGPSIDSTSFTAKSSLITCTKDGYIDDGKEYITTSSSSDVILIKTNEMKLTIKTKADSEPSQKKYLTIGSYGSIVNIQPDGNFGKGQIGIHPNGEEPNIHIPTSSVPLNFYINEANVITIQFAEIFRESTPDKISMKSILSHSGSLEISAKDTTVNLIEFDEVNIYNDGYINSLIYGSNNPIVTSIKNLTLNQGSSSTLSNVLIGSQLTAKPGAKVAIKGKVTFNDLCSISMSQSSFIDLGDSVVEGICDSLTAKVDELKSSKLLENEEETFICGSNFDCENWVKKFSSDDYSNPKCDKKCLVATRKVKSGPKGGLSKGAIAAIVIAVILAVAAGVVAFFIIIKKKRQDSDTGILQSSFQTNDI